jgi:uncharacterized membrane protein
MIHFYRGEMNRATVWRQRLDVTTNWAVATTAGILTFTLGNAQAPHGTFLLGVIISLIMLHLEARRYMYYDIWRARLRMIERGLIAPALWKGTAERELAHEPEWRRMLAEDLHEAHFHMPYSEAFGRRLQRNYIWLLLLNYVAWLLKVHLSPTPATTWAEFVRHAGAGPIPGATMLGVATIGFVFFVVLARVTTRHRHARGEARPYEHARESERWGVV